MARAAAAGVLGGNYLYYRAYTRYAMRELQ